MLKAINGIINSEFAGCIATPAPNRWDMVTFTAVCLHLLLSQHLKSLWERRTREPLKLAGRNPLLASGVRRSPYLTPPRAARRPLQRETGLDCGRSRRRSLLRAGRAHNPLWPCRAERSEGGHGKKKRPRLDGGARFPCITFFIGKWPPNDIPLSF